MTEVEAIVFTLLIFITLWLSLHSTPIPRTIRGVLYDRLSYIQPWGHLGSLGLHSGLRFVGRVFGRFPLQCVALQSPLVQTFIQSTSRTHPVVILSDLREIEDIVKRKTSLIDRADVMHICFDLLVPNASIGSD